jgi:hypothetical protein
VLYQGGLNAGKSLLVQVPWPGATATLAASASRGGGGSGGSSSGSSADAAYTLCVAHEAPAGMSPGGATLRAAATASMRLVRATPWLPAPLPVLLGVDYAWFPHSLSRCALFALWAVLGAIWVTAVTGSAALAVWATALHTRQLLRPRTHVE